MKPEDYIFLSSADSSFINDLYGRYLEDPQQIDGSWQKFFASLQDDARNLLREQQGPSWSQKKAVSPEKSTHAPKMGPAVSHDLRADIVNVDVKAAARDSIRALMLIRSYRVRGHLEAVLDPLSLKPIACHPELDPHSYGFTDADMDRPIFIDSLLGLAQPTLRQVMKQLRQIYCGSIGVEFMHIQDPEQKRWIQEKFEVNPGERALPVADRKQILEQLIKSESFEHFLDKKFVATKRFGLDGAESTIPALEYIISQAAALGTKEVVLGMAHRGRLNVLTQIVGKKLAAIFAEFRGESVYPQGTQGSGDVKYHLGASTDRDFHGRQVHVSLTANPSHLEAVNTVVLGKTRAKQRQRGDSNREQVMALLLHGDAAFAGQGLVAETLDLSELKGYRIGGTIHFIVNNQIGFTTNPINLRSGPYCSELAKAVQAPIFHVNGDDPDAVCYVAKLAVEFRHQFKKDVVVDMFCYRRFGHNETDEPAFTQPLMYKKIASHPSIAKIYSQRLLEERVLTQLEIDQMTNSYQQLLDADYQAAAFRTSKIDWLEGAWKGLTPALGEERAGNTARDVAMLHEVGQALTKIPAAFNLNRKIERQLASKKQSFETGQGIDWATAEALAFGTLLVEGYQVRLSGQDCSRGTFSQRHAVWIDQENETHYAPLNHIRSQQQHLEVIDSPLSEAGVLGFEYGYSLADPNALVMWEAQFGDFANGAQVIVDQFLSNGESKWFRMSGLVMLLPHGYEGQGPEHSSARLERYLQLCAEDNMQVVNCTSPANYFHVLRRQIHRDFRKPLIIMTPKSLLRHRLCVSPLQEMATGSAFQRVIGDMTAALNPKKINRVVFCSGKVYYDLLEQKEQKQLSNVAIIRVEQLYPFPVEPIKKQLQLYGQAEVVWCQEEPKNMGAWSFVAPLFEELLLQQKHRSTRAFYAGRTAAASPATGSMKRHELEQAQLVNIALTGKE